MKKTTFYYLNLIYFIFSTISIFGQNTILDESPFVTEYVKHKTLSKLQGKTNIKPGKDCKLVYVRLKLNLETGEKIGFDPNPFSLIVNAYKQRIRPISVRYPIAHLNVDINMVLIENRPSLLKYAGFIYDPSIIDTFENYNYEDYENITHTISWGSPNNAMKYSYYYDIRKFSDRKIDMVFIVPKSTKTASIYYGSQKIKDLMID